MTPSRPAPSRPAQLAPTQPAPDIFETQLRAASLRVTPTRLAVLTACSQALRPLSHAELAAALPEEIDRVTLYRTLDAFVEVGLLRKAVGEDRVSRFHLQDGQDHQGHAHFNCDDCGRVYCLALRAPKRPSLPDGFALEGVDLNLHGHCPDCSK